MEENLVVEFPNGETYAVSTCHIALHRAAYYAEEDGDLDIDTFDEEFDYAMGNEIELLDWVGNNMDWDYLEQYAWKLESESEDLSELWSDAEIEIRKI